MNLAAPFWRIYSPFVTYVVLAIIAWSTGAITTTAAELLQLCEGDVRQIVSRPTSLIEMMPTIFAATVLALPSALIIGVTQELILGEAQWHTVREGMRRLRPSHHFVNFFVLVVLEEVFARWLFLGVLTKIPLLSGTWGFYFLFLLGNGIWALFHLSNYMREEDRQPLRVLPQFVGGTFFTYVYVKHGLFAAVLTHFAYNAVLLAAHKVRDPSVIDVLLTVYSLLCATVSWWLMDKPLSDIVPWFSTQPTFVLPGWVFWDYLKVSVLLGSAAPVLFHVFAYDRHSSDSDEEAQLGLTARIIQIPMAVGASLGLYLLLGFVVTSALDRVLVLAVVLSCLQRERSGSAVARTFWTTLPTMYVAICVFHALGFWQSLALVGIETVLVIPSEVLRAIDDDD